jgi:hypothetical protein
MMRLLTGEMIKVRTTRTAFGFGAAAVLLTLATVLISILAGDLTALEDKRNALNFGGAISIVLLLYGAVGATGEFRHRTLAPAVLIAPDRLRLVLARIGAYKLTALGFGVVMGIVALGLGAALRGGEPGQALATSDYVKLAAGGLIAVAAAAAIGVGVGTLVRNQVAAVVGILVWLSILEPLVGAIDDRWTKYTLGETISRVGLGGTGTMGFGASILLLVAWTLVLCTAGALLDRRRDVD